MLLQYMWQNISYERHFKCIELKANHQFALVGDSSREIPKLYRKKEQEKKKKKKVRGMSKMWNNSYVNQFHVSLCPLRGNMPFLGQTFKTSVHNFGNQMCPTKPGP